MAKDIQALDIKTAIKQARDLFKGKEYLSAIKICKKILKEDKRNYNALVLMAAAMREIDDCKKQVSTQLKKAIDVQPDNPLAWQGLMAYYEDQPDTADTWTELIPVYIKLLQVDRYNHYLGCIFFYI